MLFHKNDAAINENFAKCDNTGDMYKFDLS